MKVNVAEFDGPALLLHAEGRISILTADDFHDEILKIIARSRYDVIVDASDVNYLSTAGLRVFLILSRRLTIANRSLHICNLKPYILEVFQTIGFDNLIPTYPDLDSALDAIQAETC